MECKEKHLNHSIVSHTQLFRSIHSSTFLHNDIGKTSPQFISVNPLNFITLPSHRRNLLQLDLVFRIFTGTVKCLENSCVFDFYSGSMEYWGSNRLTLAINYGTRLVSMMLEMRDSCGFPTFPSVLSYFRPARVLAGVSEIVLKVATDLRNL